MSFLKDKLVIILCLVGFLLYFPSLFGTFVWDDEDFVYANRNIANFEIGKFFTQSITSGRGKVSNYYRPIQSIYYSSIYSIFGFNPFWYHFFSIIVHIAATGAIFYFLTLLTRARGPSFLVALFFLIHPLQTETVSYISGVSDSLYVLFGLLSLVFSLKKKRIVSLIFFILTLFSKETGIVFLPLIALTEALKESSMNYAIAKKMLPKILPFVLIALIYLYFHFTYINQMDMRVAWGGDSVYANSVLIRLATFIQNLPTYFGLLLFPKDLFMERDFGITIAKSAIFPIVIFLLANAIFLVILRKLVKKTGDLFGLLFFYTAFWLSFIPYSGLVLINGIFYEHFLYLPLIWFFSLVVFSGALFLSNTKPMVSRLIKIAFIIIVILLMGRNIVRQFDWSDDVRFYQQTLAHASGSVRIRNGLAMALSQRGRDDEAIAVYVDSIAAFSNVPNLYHNLANVYASQGKLNLAEKNYLKALEIDPKFYYSARALQNLYEVMGQKGKKKK